ncbi:MAG: hypothetical protein P4L50_03350 [Anaerolineaceae bacterium]|nr:hypothetical protein [Anaerolineaceae bacterium]
MTKPGFIWDNDQPLARCKGEGKRANYALNEYFRLGSGRNLRALLKQFIQQSIGENPTIPPTKSWWTLCSWSDENGWVERVNRACKLQQEADDRLWAERRLSIRERDYQQGQDLRKLADTILSETPNYLKTSTRFIKGRHGRPDKEIVTIAIDTNLAVRAIETASKIDRLAAGMETEHAIQDVVIGEDLEKIREKRWAQIAPTLVDALSDYVDNPTETSEEPSEDDDA